MKNKRDTKCQVWVGELWGKKKKETKGGTQVAQDRE